MEVSLLCPAYRRYDLLKEMVLSAEANTIKPSRYVFYDNGLSLPEKEFEFISDRLTLIKPNANHGCTYAWNRMIEITSDIRIIVNDDIKLYPNTIEELVKAYNYNTLIFPHNDTENGFSCFMLPDGIVQEIGLFDENFFNYFSDNDLVRRINLNPKVTYTSITSTTFGHFGSASIKTYNANEMEDHHRMFRKNQAYYVQKWGALPGQEIYTTEFNGKDSRPIINQINSRNY